MRFGIREETRCIASHGWSSGGSYGLLDMYALDLNLTSSGHMLPCDPAEDFLAGSVAAAVDAAAAVAAEAFGAVVADSHRRAVVGPDTVADAVVVVVEGGNLTGRPSSPTVDL